MPFSLTLFVVGRVIFGLYFLMNAYNHLFKSGGMVGYAKYKGVPSPALAVIVAGLLLLLGGLSFVTGMYLFWGTIALILFFVPVTFKIHAFWKETDPQKKMLEQIQFGKNLALLSTLLMFLSIFWPI